MTAPSPRRAGRRSRSYDHRVGRLPAVADLAAHRARRGLCAICRHWVLTERLWTDRDGNRWDVCAECGDTATTLGDAARTADR